ncbi:unnamed protein product, partial [Oppiella nova]
MCITISRGQVDLNDTVIDETFNELEFLGTGKTLPDTPDTIDSYCQYIRSNASEEHNSGLWAVANKWAAGLRPGVRDTINGFIQLGFYGRIALKGFCRLNTTSAVTVAKGYNSRLAISHLLKDATIAKISRAARHNNRNTLTRIHSTLRAYIDLIELAHNESIELNGFAYGLVLSIKVGDINHVYTNPYPSDISEPNKCEPGSTPQPKSTTYI